MSENPTLSCPLGGEGRIILFIDDNSLVRECSQLLLLNLGYRVLLAESGLQGIAIYGRYHDQIAMVIRDVGMPQMDGYETLSVLKKINPQNPIILSCDYCEQANCLFNAAAKGAAGFLPKPHSLKSLASGLEEVFAGH